MSAIVIVGKSGTGKSTSYSQIPDIGIKGLNPKETVVINVSGKDLPFKQWKKAYAGNIKEGGNYFEDSDPVKITNVIKYVSSDRADIKNIIIDDAQYIMAFEFMRRAKESGYTKFADIGVNISKIIEAARLARKGLKVFFIWHPENDGEGGLKMKTVGNMVDAYLTLEGLFTTILYSKVSRGTDNKLVYQFVTNHDGQYPARSPVGMFKDLYIANDLGLVADLIDEFNN